MPFAAETLDNVMGMLRLPLTRFFIEAVQDALNHAEVYGGEVAIARIEALIVDYKANKLALKDGAGNSGLIQAGPLKWQAGSRNSGFHSENAELINELASSLNLTNLLTSRQRGKVRLRR